MTKKRQINDAPTREQLEAELGREKYRRRYSPYGSVACIYLWAVSAGAVEGLKDYAPQEKASNKRKKR